MAKRFKFRLQKVLEYRQAIEADRKKELMLANRTLFEEEERLRLKQQALMANEMGSGRVLSVGEIAMVDEYSARLRNEIEHQKRYVREAEEAVERARQLYLEATRDAESLDRLREKRKEEYRVYLEKEEEKFLDELTTQRSGFGNATKE